MRVPTETGHPRPPQLSAGDVGTEDSSNDRSCTGMFAVEQSSGGESTQALRAGRDEQRRPRRAQGIQRTTRVGEDTEDIGTRRAQAAVEFESEQHLGQFRPPIGAFGPVIPLGLQIRKIQALGAGREAADGDDPATCRRRQHRGQMMDEREVPEMICREHQLVALWAEMAPRTGQ